MGAWHKLLRHVRLLRQEPDTFGFNLLQFCNPARLQDKLLDMLQAPPLQLRLEPALRLSPALNVLQPTLSPEVMTGGPNTVLNLALWVAHTGLPVRIVTMHATPPAQQQWFLQHMAIVSGEPLPPQSLSVACAGDAAAPLAIGPADMFLATHWTTAQQLKPWLARMDSARFFYLIQDFEPGFYAWSSNYALALETYGLDHIAVFNQSLLRDYFVAQGVGAHASPAFAARSLVFEPAVDRAHFHPCATPRPRGRRRLLFYARPGNARNLLGLGLQALRAAVGHAVFTEQDWEFWAIGSNNGLPPLPLGSGRTLQPAPWMDYRAYAQLLRESDILLCPMLSPHTSYPVLEMVASGGLAVTTTFACKTAERLRQISANFVPAPATEEALARALVSAALRVRLGVGLDAPVHLPRDWRTALQPVAQRLVRAFLHNAGDACTIPPA